MNRKMPFPKYQLRLHFFSLITFFFLYIFMAGAGARAKAVEDSSTVPVNVGVVLDLQSTTTDGKQWLSCINMSLSDFYASHGSSYRTRIVLNLKDSRQDKVAAAAAALDLVKNIEVQAILGPQSSMEADFIIDIGTKAQVPIISFSATSPTLDSVQRPYFIRATQNDSSQVLAISTFLQVHGWREVVIVYVDNDFGRGIIPSLVDALQEIEVQVSYRSIIYPLATDDMIREELYKLMTMKTRVFIVHMLPDLGSRIFQKAEEVGMMDDGYVWLMTNGITDLLSFVDPSVVSNAMQGVLGVKTYVSNTTQLHRFNKRWNKIHRGNPTIFGLWAYDAAKALAMAIEKTQVEKLNFKKGKFSTNSTDLETFGVSQNGHRLLQSFAEVKFTGLAGEFFLQEGHLPTSNFEIVNINGNAARGIGFWIPNRGLVKDLSNTSSESKLRPIIWPGDSTSPPRGWQIPTNGKRLQIVVPMKHGFYEFMKVTKDFDTNTTTVEGYCKDIFDAVMDLLPYPVLYDFIPFVSPGYNITERYNDLIDQVFYKNYDAAVGDITIIANRTKFIDFTMPYTQAGVYMVVPIRDDTRKNPWVFLEPLSWELWLLTGVSFISIGFTVWVLEHSINEDFDGPLKKQLGTVLCFAFSTMVFAQREKLKSNLTRFVVVVWFFLVLILTQSYTASLTSTLTVEKLQPTVTSIGELINKGENVGYEDGSYIHDLLRQYFDEPKLKSFSSPEEMDHLFSLGSTRGGIGAAFDDVPALNVFLSKYCNKYTMLLPIVFKTPGYGFVFPKGSPLVPDVSRAIVNLTQGPKMKQIEDKWIPQKDKCSDSSTRISSHKLSIGNFWGLFSIAGASAFVALVIYEARSRKNNWNTPVTGLGWKKFVNLARTYSLQVIIFPMLETSPSNLSHH